MQAGWVRALEAILLVYAQALLVNHIHTRFQLTERQTFIPGFLFITVTSLLPASLILTPVMLSYLFVLLAIRELFLLPLSNITSERLFYTSFFLGISAMLYWPATIFLAVVLVGLILFARAGWREIAIILIAFVMPFYFLGIYFYYQDRLFEYTTLLRSVFPELNLTMDFSLMEWTLIGYIVLLLIYGYFEIHKNSGSYVIKLKRYYSHTQYSLLILLIPVLFIQGEKLFYLYFFSFPVTVFLVPLFNRDKPGWFRTALFLLLILSAAYFQWQYIATGQI